MRELNLYSDIRLAKWYSTFDGEPLTSNPMNIFSVLQRVAHHMFYDPALLFHPEEGPTDMTGDREDDTVQAVLKAFRGFDKGQL